MQLKISLQPPPYAFVDDWFSIEAIIEGSDELDSSKLDNREFQIDAELHFFDGGVCGDAWNSAQLKIDPGTEKFYLRDIVDKSVLVVRFNIVPNRIGDNTSVYCIKLYVSDSEHNAYDQIKPIITTPVHLVSSKFVLETDEWESIWYKDEGGRDKCMQVIVSLCNKNNSLIYGRKLPLVLTLLYDNEYDQEVMKQSNLKVMGAPKVFIDPDSGQASLRFRIEDVSKNHQGQNFKVLIATKCNKYGDVAPATTPSVAVRSKRNKRGRSTIDSPLRRRFTTGFASHAIRPSRMSLADHGLQIDESSIQQGFRGIRDIDKLREAMKGVIRWTEEVVHGLHPLQWQVIGYAQYPDGTIDYNHPYYNMPNPNNAVSKILQLYSDTVRDDFKVLLNAVEQTVAEDDHPKASIQDDDGTFESCSGASVGQHGLQQLKQTAESIRKKPIQSHFEEQVGATPDQTPTTVSRSFGSGDSPMDYYGLAKMNETQNISTFLDNDNLAPDDGRASNGYTVTKSDIQGNHFNYDFDVLMNAKRNEGKLDTNTFNNDSLIRAMESEIFYVISKQYKSVRTGSRLGFPVFNREQQLIGFYQNHDKSSSDYLIPITMLEDEFGPRELEQATQILSDAIVANSGEVDNIERYDSVHDMLNSLMHSWQNMKILQSKLKHEDNS